MECAVRVGCYSDTVITVRDSGHVDPLTIKARRINIRTSHTDPLVLTRVLVASRTSIKALKVHHAPTIFVSGHRDLSSLLGQEFVKRVIREMIMVMTRGIGPSVSLQEYQSLNLHYPNWISSSRIELIFGSLTH